MELYHAGFKLSADLEATRAMFVDAGFNEVKMWFQPANWHFRSGDDLVVKYLSVKGGPCKDPAVVEEAVRIYDEKYRDEMNIMETLIILAFKD